MKSSKFLSFFSAAFLVCLVMSITAAAQSDSAARDTSVIIPFPQLGLENIQAIGNKRTGTLVISMDFVNNVKDNFVQVGLSFGGPSSFVFASDKGKRYTVHTYYNEMYENNPNGKYESVKNIKFGDKEMWLATVILQEIDTGQRRQLMITLPSFDKASKEIREFAVHCDLKVRYDPVGTGYYKVNRLPIIWKEEAKKVQSVKKGK